MYAVSTIVDAIFHYCIRFSIITLDHGNRVFKNFEKVKIEITIKETGHKRQAQTTEEPRKNLILAW